MKKNEHYKCNEYYTIWLEENLHGKCRIFNQDLLYAILHLIPVTISFLDTFWTKHKSTKF